MDTCSKVKNVIGIQSNRNANGAYAVTLDKIVAEKVTAVSSGAPSGVCVSSDMLRKVRELTAYSPDDIVLCSAGEGVMPVISFGVYSGLDSPIRRSDGGAESEISYSDLDQKTIYALSGDDYITDAKLRDNIGRSVYMGDPLFDAVNADPMGTVNGSIYGAAGSGTFSADVVVSSQDSIDDIRVTVSRDGADVTDDFTVSVEKRTADGYEDEGILAAVKVSSIKDVTVGEEYDVIVTYRNSSASFKMAVKDIDYSLNFTYPREYNDDDVYWNYGGDFTGTEDNCSGSGWSWYGSAADGYDSNTLVLDGLDFHTTARKGIMVSGNVTIIVKGVNNISAQYMAIAPADGTVNIIGEDGAKIIAGTEQCYNSMA